MPAKPPTDINTPLPGDLVYIIDPDGVEPIKMGIGLVVGPTKIYSTSSNKYTSTTPVLWDGTIQYLDKPYWMFEVIARNPHV